MAEYISLGYKYVDVVGDGINDTISAIGSISIEHVSPKVASKQSTDGKETYPSEKRPEPSVITVPVASAIHNMKKYNKMIKSKKTLTLTVRSDNDGENPLLFTSSDIVGNVTFATATDEGTVPEVNFVFNGYLKNV